MKHSIKPALLCLFAVLFSACLPHEKLTWRVIDLTGPVPEAAVLGMVWIEDVDKARPVPDTEDLKPEDRDAALEKDMKDRGLPVAYARAFSDKNGWFTLDKLHFSAETKKAVKAMRQPKITRITLNAFQHGYLKHAATVFPKSAVKELSPATVILSRPESWKQLALDSSFRTLRRDEYDAGYSKEFGATKMEKGWFLEYTNSNLNKSYAESNIKGDKVWEEDCGHDYGDIIISTTGMQRNPAHEKCNRLLRQMGVLRDWKEEWLDHSIAITQKPEPSVSAVKAALEALGPEYAEVKANEASIIAGVDEAENQHRKSQANQDIRNGLNENKTGTEEAQRIYNTGDKAGAYRVLGRGLYSQLLDEVRYGALTAQLPLKIIPGITDAVAGFYLLVNKPLTAQLPNGDNGNHKDKPGYKVEGTTETAGVLKNDVSSAGNPKEIAQTAKSKQRIEEVFENNHKLIRFYGKDGRKTKDINLKQKETKIRISKAKDFNPSGFKIKISSVVIAVIEENRKSYGRDISFTRQESRTAHPNQNGRFFAVDSSYLDFVEFADARDGELSGDPVETDRVTAIYEQYGTKIFELNRSDGWQPIVSNTGQFFVVIFGENEKTRIINRNKEVLAEFNGVVRPVFFSENDKYILLVYFNPNDETGTATLSVFDTTKNKLELKKIILPWSTFAANESPEIYEDTRTMIIRHAWEPATKEAKVDTIQF